VTLLKVVHTTRFDYASPVTDSYNQARMRPVHDARQTVRSATLTTSPTTWSADHTDYWGTGVTAFEILRPHTQLTIVAEALVEASGYSAGGRPAGDVPGWEDLASEPVLDAHAAFLAESPVTMPPSDLAALALAAAGGLDPDRAAEAICLAVRERLEYVPGVTTVHTPADEAWEARKGVCQDMAHLALGALRSVGIPARYVSGYLHPDPNAQFGETVLGESHAWVEWFAGDWRGYDPTNLAEVAEHHVLVGRGRDYSDVPPLRGVYAGPGASELFVTVEITRMA
jgi:transglutaminase-like putative cysteine protease